MSITFEVIDLNCQQSDNSFFVPQISLSSKSTTQFATLYGYNEFVNPSTPPKKYRTVTITGFSKRVAFTTEQAPRQCGGANYTWSGTGQVDFKGNIVQRYNKNFYAQCSKQYWPLEALQTLPGAITTGGNPPMFVSFCWPDIGPSCQTCDPNQANWSFIGNQALNTPGSLAIDLQGFLTNQGQVVTKTSFSVNNVITGITSIVPDQSFTFELFGTELDNYNVVVGPTTYTGRDIVTNPLVLDFPARALRLGGPGNQFIVADYINFTDTNNYSAVLSDEYTDAQALANATVVTGTGRTAQNLPRTTGFTSITTNVVFTLLCSNLISGRDYVVTVQFWSQDAFDDTLNSFVTNSYGFTASGTTHTITDVVPTPPANQITTVQKPTIAFA